MIRTTKSITKSLSPIFAFCNANKINNESNSQQPVTQPAKPTLIIRRPQVKQKSESNPQKKSYYMPQRPKSPAFFVNKQIHFKNGRYLLYLNNQNLSTPYLLDLHFLLPMGYLAFLIKTNPFYLTFPAALPLMFLAECTFIYRYVDHKAHHKRQLQRIYLLKDGFRVQFIYANKIRRFMKDNQQSEIFPVSAFQSKYDHQIEEGRVPRYRGVRLPADDNTPLQDAVRPSAIEYGWTVRDSNFIDYVIPAKFQYANWALLLAVLNGIPVIIPPELLKETGTFMFGNFPKIEEEYQNVKDLNMGYTSKQPNLQSQPNNLNQNVTQKQSKPQVKNQ